MAQQFFDFQQFRVHQSRSAMKVSTDACLFGAWIPIGSSKSVLDAGTGTGLLALMVAQRAPLAQISAVDFENGAIADAITNFQNSPYKDRLRVTQADILEFEHEPFELVVCNPPFFSGTPSQNSSRAKARHQHSWGKFLSALVELTAKDGSLVMLLPCPGYQGVMDEAKHLGLYPSLMTKVFPHRGKPANRAFLQFRKSQSSIRETQITIYDPHPEYSAEFAELLGDFYLRFASS